jgi:hypothetical protein
MSVQLKTVSTSPNINATKAVKIINLAPTAAGLGANFAALADLIAIYELMKIDKIEVTSVPDLPTGTIPSIPYPWITGYVPNGGTNPVDSTSFEGPHSSNQALPINSGLNTALSVGHIAKLILTTGALTLLNAAVGGAAGWLATNGLGAQTDFGSIWWASVQAAGAVNNTVTSTIKGWFSFRDLYDPVMLRRNAYVLGALGKLPAEHRDEDVVLFLTLDIGDVRRHVRLLLNQPLATPEYVPIPGVLGPVTVVPSFCFSPETMNSGVGERLSTLQKQLDLLRGALAGESGTV